MIPAFSWSDLRVWLGLTLALLVVQAWIMFSRAWRKDPPGFLWRSFMDARDVPDGKLLTVFNAVMVLNVTMLVGWATGKWPPVYVWATWGTIVLIGIGADAYITRTQIGARAGELTPPAGENETMPLGETPAFQPAAGPDPSPLTNGPQL